jgi:hypothetical protein
MRYATLVGKLMELDGRSRQDYTPNGQSLPYVMYVARYVA